MPPTVDVEIVKRKGANEAVALVTVNETQKELYLKHRDLDRLDYLQLKDGEPILPTRAAPGGIISFDANHKMQIQGFTLATDATEYEVVGDGRAPTITESTYAISLGEASSGPHPESLLGVAFMDTAGLSPTPTDCNKYFLELFPVKLKDALDNSALTVRDAELETENFLKVQSGTGKVCIDLPTEAFYIVDGETKTDVVDGLTIKYQEEGGTDQTLSNPEIMLPNQSRKTISLWVEKPGFLASEKKVYTITAQTTIYTGPNDISVNPATDQSPGLTADAMRTFDKAIARANRLLAKNDVTVLVLGSISFVTFTEIGNSSSTNTLTLKGDDSKGYKVDVSGGDTNQCKVVGNVVFDNISLQRHFAINDKNSSQKSSLTLKDTEIAGDASENSLGDKVGITVNKEGELVMEGKSRIEYFLQGVKIGEQSGNNKGTFIMKGGTITNCTNSGDSNIYAAGVMLAGGTFTMEGGFITGNVGKYTGNTSGAGVCGAGVYVGSGTFTMKAGATINENKAEKSDTSGYNHGGGVYLHYATSEFVMEGGTIEKNEGMDGAGVNVGQGNFTMQGGTIKSNTADRNGGGVYVAIESTFTMTGGTIGGNSTDGNKAQSGAGVYLYNSGGKQGQLFMSGGSIKGNNASGTGGGIYNMGTVYLYGTAVIGDASANTEATESACSNKAGRWGGAVYFPSGATLYIGYKPPTTDGDTPEKDIGHSVKIAYNYTGDKNSCGAVLVQDNTCYIYSGNFSNNKGPDILIGSFSYNYDSANDKVNLSGNKNKIGTIKYSATECKVVVDANGFGTENNDKIHLSGVQNGWTILAVEEGQLVSSIVPYFEAEGGTIGGDGKFTSN